MDCNMPVMDGFAATKHIRQHETQTGSRLPIIALTANATFENTRLCEQAGMDSVTTKPFSLADLESILTKCFTNQ